MFSGKTYPRTGPVISICIPLFVIPEQPGKSFVTFYEAQKILEKAFESPNHVASHALKEQLTRSTEVLLPDGLEYRCKVWYDTMRSLAVTADHDNSFASHSAVVEWVKNQIVTYLIENNLVANNLFTEPNRKPSKDALKVVLCSKINVTVK